MGFVQDICDFIIKIINTAGPLGVVISCGFITIESMIPVLPLAVFLTINFVAFGNLFGFIISYIFTIIGCLFSFYLFRKKIQNRFNDKIRVLKAADKLMKYFEKITFSQYVVIVAIPFFPAFLINIAAGLSKMEFKKYFVGLLIGKIALVYFWGYIGSSLLESISNPAILIKVSVMLLVAFIVSKLVNRTVKIDPKI